MHPAWREHKHHWALMVYAVFATHVLLDSFTAYGTQIFWPFVTTPMTWSTLFIIDPLYTVPLLIGILAALTMRRETAHGHLINRLGLIASTVYLSWTVAAKAIVENHIEASLLTQNIVYQRIFTTPAPFNSLLWRAVVKDDNGYYEAYYSFLDKHQNIRFRHYPSDETLLRGIEDHWPVQRLKWFSKGFYAVSLQEDDIIISDLRMGVEPNYVFSFKVGKISNPHAKPAIPQQLDTTWDWRFLKIIWQRIWNDSVILHPRHDPISIDE